MNYKYIMWTLPHLQKKLNQSFEQSECNLFANKCNKKLHCWVNSLQLKPSGRHIRGIWEANEIYRSAQSKTLKQENLIPLNNVGLYLRAHAWQSSQRSNLGPAGPSPQLCSSCSQRRWRRDGRSEVHPGWQWWAPWTRCTQCEPGIRPHWLSLLVA